MVAHAAGGSAALEGVLAWARRAGGEGCGTYDAAAGALAAWAGSLDAAQAPQRAALLHALGLLGAMGSGRVELWQALLHCAGAGRGYSRGG